MKCVIAILITALLAVTIHDGCMFRARQQLAAKYGHASLESEQLKLTVMSLASDVILLSDQNAKLRKYIRSLEKSRLVLREQDQ